MPSKCKTALKPVSRETGEAVTIANCTSSECRWGYGVPDADMVLCGRETGRHGPWCPDHRAIAYQPNRPVAQ